MDDRDWLAMEFETARPHLRAVAYRMLGSVAEADDAVQEAWLRLSRADAGAIENLHGWLTTVVGRVCLDLLRARRSRREDYVGTWLPEPIVTIGTTDPENDPEQEAMLADSVGIALLVVLETLTPAERLAFVLHDMFGVSFGEIAGVVGRSPAAARQLASRARRRVRGAAPAPDPDLALQRRVVDAFLAAARSGDFERLLEVLDPEVVFRTDVGAAGARPPVIGAKAVADVVLSRGVRFAPRARPAVVNGTAGLIVPARRGVRAVLGFTVSEGRIVELDLILDTQKLRRVAAQVSR